VLLRLFNAFLNNRPGFDKNSSHPIEVWRSSIILCGGRDATSVSIEACARFNAAFPPVCRTWDGTSAARPLAMSPAIGHVCGPKFGSTWIRFGGEGRRGWGAIAILSPRRLQDRAAGSANLKEVGPSVLRRFLICSGRPPSNSTLANGGVAVGSGRRECCRELDLVCKLQFAIHSDCNLEFGPPGAKVYRFPTIRQAALSAFSSPRRLPISR